MTEADWLNSTDPQAMLTFLRGTGRASDRKLRLYACAAVRRIGHLLTHACSWQAVDMAERHAEGLVGDAERDAAAAVVEDWVTAGEADHRNFTGDAASVATLRPDAAQAAGEAARLASGAECSDQAGWRGELAAQAGLLRDLLGNPFCPSP